MLIQTELTLGEKLKILTDAAKYDVACTSSGVDRKGEAGSIGNTASYGICHTFSADGRCVSLLKILMTNTCIYDCRYCVNRISNDTVRTWFEPEEICRLTIEFYRRNYIEGLFLSSGILNTPGETMERICRTLLLLRDRCHFRGYIHVKAIPGAPPELIELAGRLADRMSVNLELPTGDGLRSLAPAKTREKILAPMRQIQRGISAGRLEQKKREKDQPVRNAFTGEPACVQPEPPGPAGSELPSGILLPEKLSPSSYAASSRFVPAGQSTQMIIGATPETDHQILTVTEALYRNYNLKRVFFSAYTAVNDDSRLPAVGTPPPLLREHRLYQADWLLRFYGFEARELISEERPYFNVLMDPKCDWALRHLDLFPVEVTRASYADLLRVPGIGVRSARRILSGRRYGKLDFSVLKKLGVVLKRAGYFITCGGKTWRPLKFEEDYLTAELVAEDKKRQFGLEDAAGSYRQMSLFDDFHLAGTAPDPGDRAQSLFGQF